MPLLELLPDADGDFAAWTPSPASIPAPFQALQDPSGADGDGSYVRSTAAGSLCLVKASAIPSLLRILSVAFVSIRAVIRRTAIAGPSGIFAPVVGVFEFVGPDVLADTAYMEYDGSSLPGWRAEVNPANGQPWTWATALAAQVGLVDNSTDDHALRCTMLRKQIWVEYSLRGPAVRGDFHG